MNRVGVLCDLSHVGEKTAADAIAYSKRPCAITHCLPRALKDGPRNKSDELFRLCASKGGVIGTSLFAPGLVAGNDATVSDVIDAMAYVLDVVGEDHVAIGTDFSLNRPRPEPWQSWAQKDKGTARNLTEFNTVKINKPEGIRRIDEFPNLTGEMLTRGWPEDRILKILGEIGCVFSQRSGIDCPPFTESAVFRPGPRASKARFQGLIALGGCRRFWYRAMQG